MTSDSTPAFEIEKEALKTEIETGIQAGVDHLEAKTAKRKVADKYHNTRHLVSSSYSMILGRTRSANTRRIRTATSTLMMSWYPESTTCVNWRRRMAIFAMSSIRPSMSNVVNAHRSSGRIVL